MAGYYWTTVLEIAITADIGMTAWRDTLNGRVVDTTWQKTCRMILLERTSAGRTVHVWMKHS